MAVDDPLVAVAGCGRVERARIGARVVRLGHREPGLHPALDERQEPFLLLFLGAVLHEDVLVPRVRRDNAEQGRRPDGVGQHLVHVRVREEVEAHPAVLLRQVRSPQTGFIHFRLDLFAQLVRVAPLAIGHLTVAVIRPQLVLVRKDVVVDDRRRP